VTPRPTTPGRYQTEVPGQDANRFLGRDLGDEVDGSAVAIDRFTDNVPFDEKMGETVHLALGRAYRSNFPPG
jgi:ribosomal protein S6E (S10)